jgi:hypothetical protein
MAAPCSPTMHLGILALLLGSLYGACMQDANLFRESGGANSERAVGLLGARPPGPAGAARAPPPSVPRPWVIVLGLDGRRFTDY